MHKAWSSIEEVPYCFSRSSVNFQGHTGQKNIDFVPNWVFPDCNSSLNSLMAMKRNTKLEAILKRCPIVFQGHPSNFKVTRYKKLPILIQIVYFRTVTPVYIHPWLWNDAQSLMWNRRGVLLFPSSSIKFQGNTGWKMDDLDQIWARILGRSQLSNPSDLPCSCCFREFLAQGAPSEINIDGKTMDKTLNEIKNPSRWEVIPNQWLNAKDCWSTGVMSLLH